MWKTLVVLAFAASTFLIRGTSSGDVIAIASSTAFSGNSAPSNCFQCPQNETYESCPILCPPRVCGINIAAVSCATQDPDDCQPGCECMDGYLRNTDGCCVLEQDCSCGGDSNATPGCGTNCGRLCSNYNKGPVACAAVCNLNGCDCKPGYVYDENINKCVLPEQCTPTCGKNEVYSNCIQGNCQPQSCSQLGYPVPCPKIDPAYCIEGCLCKDGYVRDCNGTCIPKENCPSCGGDPKAGPGCGTNCGRLCSNYNKGPVACAAVCNLNGCDCKPGYVYDENINKCVLPEQCTPTCGQDEVYSDCIQGNCEPQSCSQLGYPVPCPRIDKAYCTKGCLCKEGYVRDCNGTCIPKENCPPTCGQDEVYSDCINGNCQPQSCSQLGYPVPCDEIDQTNCIKGCLCKDGYVRDCNGTCIPKENCPSCGGDPNARPGCGTNCGRLCSNYNKGPVACILSCNLNGCDCKEEYVFDEITKKCVLPEQCTNCNQPHEIYDSCPPSCPPQTCESIGQVYACPAMIIGANCTGACRCEEGYYRNNLGQCVSKEECECNRAHEHYDSCAPRCPPQTCESIGRQYKCPIVPQYCQGACRCDDGYYRNAIGECISKQECLQCNGPDEYFTCGGACDNVCSKLSYQNQTNCPIINVKCNPMCYCKEGYARNDANICVPIDQCPVQCNQEHEIYDSCAPICPPDTCESIGKSYSCPAMVTGCNCKGACRCEKGYYRNKKGQCVTEKECLQCKGPNEYFSCGGACDNICSKLSYQNQTNCPIVNIKCNPMCYCKEGYARNDANICVPIYQCPVPKCGPDERLEQCPASLCSPQTCSQLGYPIQCPALSGDSNATCPGSPGCVCNSNDYVRNALGKCIPKTECPSCGGDPNAQTGCGVHCGNLCSNYNSPKPKFCPRICIFNSCDCKKGYVYDVNINKCVLPKDCTPVCGDNEEYNDCANNECQQRNCSQIVQLQSCSVPENCVGGCVCQDGYLRAVNGTCIPKDQCPVQCNQDHEIYDSCPPICPPQTCESIGKNYHCPAMIIGANCTGACRCEKGYYRNKMGQCVSEEECLSCGGDPNAEPGCGVNCGRLCSNYNQKDVVCPLICHVNGCDCKDKFVYDSNLGKCVFPKDCTPICSNNEVYSTCANGGCDKRNCSQVKQPKICIHPAKCYGKCVCQDGYLRKMDGVCVPEDQCPSNTTIQPVNATEAQARLNKGNIAICGEFVYQLILSNPDENCALSGIAVLIALAQLALFSIGTVLAQLEKVLNLQNKDEMRTVFPLLIKEFSNQSDVEFELAIKYYANVNYPLSNNFISESEEYFNASGQNVDFSESAQTADTINEWVSDHTHGKITNLISPDMFNADTRLALINAMYFQGNWIYQFNPNNTETKNFTKNNGDIVTVPMMYQQNSFNYAENDHYQVLQMFYKNNKFSFVVVLPTSHYSLIDIAQILKDPEVYEEMLDTLESQKVQVYLPKMLIRTQMDLVEMLQKVNCTDMFDPNNNDIQGILNKTEPLGVSAAMQQAMVSVDETGSEAAEATAIGVSATAVMANPPKIMIFNANHPFLYYILFNGIPIFCGSFAST